MYQLTAPSERCIPNGYLLRAALSIGRLNEKRKKETMHKTPIAKDVCECHRFSSPSSPPLFCCFSFVVFIGGENSAHALNNCSSKRQQQQPPLSFFSSHAFACVSPSRRPISSAHTLDTLLCYCQFTTCYLPLARSFIPN